MTGVLEPIEQGGPNGAKAGFRLTRLEMYNWGTFHGRLWSLALDGRNTLLTGDIGSGKSTLVDAVTTLLLPAHRISYNKAAGAEVRERDLRSYVLGYYKSERIEETGTTRPIALRGPDSFSVLLGVFRNDGYDQDVTLAQVFFWGRERGQGQPDRFFLTCDRPLSIAADFADFGSEIKRLRTRLRTAGCHLFNGFPEYGKDFRRRLGIESEQAMELFHQTVSMKSVGSLNEFVRQHMLEPFNVEHWIANLVTHFDDLTKAHDAVVKAREQLERLDPILAECDTHDALRTEIHALEGQIEALPYFCAERKSVLLEARIEHLVERRTALGGELSDCLHDVERLQQRQMTLELERAGCGGDRLAAIERELTDLEQQRGERQAKWDRFNQLLREVDIPQIERPEQFAARREDIGRRDRQTRDEEDDARRRLQEHYLTKQGLETHAKEVNTELRSLQSRRTNIPSKNLELRHDLCTDLGIDQDDLPLAGELIQVRPEHSAWEGAAERVLHGFALSMLVPETHYRAVSDWINARHLGRRIVYYRIPNRVMADPLDSADFERQLYARLEIKDCEFTPWLERELLRRAGYECVETMDEFRQAKYAVTREGQVKGGGYRHEKDDRWRIDDRSRYVLGWDNRQKIDTLLTEAVGLQTRLNAVQEEIRKLDGRQKDLSARLAALARLDELREPRELDWQDSVRTINDLLQEKQQLEAASSELAELGRAIEETTEKLGKAGKKRDQLNSRIGGVEKELEQARADLDREQEVATDPASETLRDHLDKLAILLEDRTLADPDACDRLRREVEGALNTSIGTRTNRLHTAANRAAARMSEFKQLYPQETVDMDNSIESAGEYRELQRQLTDDDLPRFETQFKEYLNKNTINDIATFQAQLNRQETLIRERLATINRSLVGIDYNPGRYIRLEQHHTTNVEVREFRASLRACTDSSISGEEADQYSEQKFLQVKTLIERFRGRPGLTDVDRVWTRRVTDVRNWSVFSASERWREDDTEHENYADSGGKSGGQKEKLAYTILAASLAYQFKLEWGASKSKTFRFAVIDEAFGRGSDDSTRFALELFQQLGLQLLIVTPLQKIHIIEPYVSCVGFVDNTREGDDSRLQNLTIEEYRERRSAHGAAS